MFLYLIELYFLGTLLFTLLSEDLPAAIRSVGGILLGFLVYVLNGMVLIGVGIGLTLTSIVISTTLELVIVLICYLSGGSSKKLFHKKTIGTILGVGAIYLTVVSFFYTFNLSFVTNDSLYLILMGKDLVQSGFAEWYYASPANMGIYMGVIQTLGQLFGLDYVWFIQPVFSLILVAALVYFGYRSTSRYIHKKWISALLVIGAILVFETANMPHIMLTYIHTNLTSGLFLFLTVLSLYYAIEEDNEGWLVLSGFALISFGLMRIENVIVALTLIFFYLASGKLTRKQSSFTFIPYLIIQGIWYFSVYLMDINTFLSSMNKIQILLTSLACFAMIAIILFSRWQFLRRILDWAGKIFPFFLLLVWTILGILNPSSYVTNLRSLGSALFLTGNWGSFWYIMIFFFLISLFLSRFPQKRILLRFMVSFVAIVEILGFFRVPYHEWWTDSANRMMIHIAPLVVFFIVTQVASLASRSPMFSGDEDMEEIV